MMSGAAGERVAQRGSMQPPYCLQEPADNMASVMTIYLVGDDNINLP